ncbi:hypothetical protein BDV39DRAFT_208518 [Aspergillus sergii]|uniref:Wax synthase domain-containing protein n=1 Tax=Aspergillus sergii TaxID=1034303 RepID=A0A5N6WSL6_9EURO|nr:hypothetical protein BDV39DRAFT_208518 [Aspergillus sergii]
MGEALCSKSRQQPHEVIHGHEVDLSLETARRRLKALILNAVFEYILLDLCIVLAGYDPYFSGAGTAISPVIETLPFIFFFARAYRVILCLIMFRCFMTIGCTIGQAITLGLSITFRQSAQVFTSAPLIAEWLYPDILGSMQVVADQGLVGFWGSYWHQLLRFSLTSCSRFVLSLIPEKLRRFQIVRVLLMAIVPFFVSGLSHLPGSFIQNNNTQPFMELTVKMEQCLGVILQQFWVSVVVPKVFPVGSVPRRVRQFTNLVFVLLWFILTGPHLLDGYARDGIYCVEVLPFSLVRMLGFGSGRWLRWTKFPLEVWRGPTWWHTGIRIV